MGTMTTGAGRHGRPNRRRDTARRVADILLSIVLALLTLPLQLVAAIGSAIALRAWPLFVQERIGRDGRPFRFIKLRTLPVSTPAYADKFQLDLAAVPSFCPAPTMSGLGCERIAPEAAEEPTCAPFT